MAEPLYSPRPLTLREEQAQATRLRVLDAARALIHERRSLEFTLAELADWSGVSLATIYRHFDGRSGVLQAVARADDPQDATSPPDWPSAYSPDLQRFQYERFARNRSILEAERGSGLHAELRQARLAARTPMVEAWIAAANDTLPAEAHRRTLAVLLALTSSDNYLHLTEASQLDLDEAADATIWTIQTLLRAVAAENA
jgi:AcrR family transcriptional regulator